MSTTGGGAATERIRISTRPQPSALRWAVAALVAVLALCAYLWVTQPQNRWAVLVVLALLVLGVLVLVSERRWIEPGTGVVEASHLWLWRRRVAIGPTTSVGIVSNGGGGVLLRLRPRRSRSLYVTLLQITDYGETSPTPDVLRLYATVLETRRAGGARLVVQLLRQQAEHVEHGGELTASPLARFLSYGIVNAAKGGAAGGIAGHL